MSEETANSESMFDTKFISDSANGNISESATLSSANGSSAALASTASASTATSASAASVATTASNGHQTDSSNEDLSAVLPSDEVSSTALISLRILVSIKEAGIIIGKNGSIIADIREKTGVKAGVSKVIVGCQDRILTVTGPIDNIAQALGLIANALFENPLDDSLFQYFPLKRLLPKLSKDVTSIRLLIPNAQMGTVIGRQGARIKALQENFNVKIVASKDFLFNSTERLVEVQGTPHDIQQTISVLARCLLEDWHSATNTNFYFPSPRNSRRQLPNNLNSNNSNSNGYYSSPSNEVTTVESFPAEMVGCLIGKAGVRIQEIRRVSGAQIIIASEDNDNAEREFTFIGSPRSVEKALGMLNVNLQKEQERREKLASSSIQE